MRCSMTWTHPQEYHILFSAASTLLYSSEEYLFFSFRWDNIITISKVSEPFRSFCLLHDPEARNLFQGQEKCFCWYLQCEVVCFVLVTITELHAHALQIPRQAGEKNWVNFGGHFSLSCKNVDCYEVIWRRIVVFHI